MNERTNGRMLQRVQWARLRDASLGESRNFAKSKLEQVEGEQFSSPMARLLISLLGRADYFLVSYFLCRGEDR